MTQEMVVQVARRAFEATLLLSAPLLLASLVIGVLVSMFQTVTSINEATLSFVPKLIVIMVVLLVFFPWMMSYMTDFTKETYQLIDQMRH